jgi:hypothetical protein
MPSGGRASGFQQLVRYLRQCTDNDDGMHIQPAFHDSNQPFDGRRIFDRRPSELHHDNIFTPLKSALSLLTAHVLSAPF